MKLLFVTEISPFPPFGGEKIRTNGLLNIFETLKLNTLAIVGNTESDAWKHNFRHINFHDFNFRRCDKGRWGEAFAVFKKDRNLTKILTKVIEDFKPDVAYIDYYFYGQYINLFKKYAIPVIYGTHNAQAQLVLQRPGLSVRNKISNYFEYLLYSLHEKTYLKQAGALIAVSEQDMDYYRRFINPSRLHLIPNFLNESDYIPFQKASNEKENYIIMTGNFRAYQNAAGLRWFLEKVWDNELSDVTRFIISGNYSKEIMQTVNGSTALKNVEAIGEVENLKPFIAKARVALVPLLHGSGTRLKCIEAMALKTQIVSTPKGAEGIEHGGSIILAADAVEFKQALLNVLGGQLNYTEDAFRAFVEHYSLKPNALIFNNILTRLT